VCSSDLEAKRALNKKDYVTATLKSIESLKAKKNFKKSNDIFEKALSQVNTWGSNYIKVLEARAIPYKNYHSVESMKEIFISYAKLDNVQKKLLEVSEGLSSKQQKFILLHTVDYEKNRNEAENLLNAYNNNAADEFYTEGIQAFNNAKNKYDYKEVFRIFEISKSYVDDYKDVRTYLDKSLNLAILNVGYFPVRNLSNNRSSKNAMEALVVNTTGFFNNYTFANYSEISNKIQLRNLGMLNDKGKAQLKNIDELVKFKFSRYYAGPTVIKSKVFYSNTKEKKKKDGTVKKWYCEGYKYELTASGYVKLTVEIIDNNGDLLATKNINISKEHNDSFFLATKDSDRRAYPLQNKYRTSMPQEFNMPNALRNIFNSYMSDVFKRYK
jgi:hypothetical protein